MGQVLVLNKAWNVQSLLQDKASILIVQRCNEF